MQTREDRERRVKKLRDLVQAGLYQTDPDRLAEATRLVAAGRVFIRTLLAKVFSHD